MEQSPSVERQSSQQTLYACRAASAASRRPCGKTRALVIAVDDKTSTKLEAVYSPDWLSFGSKDWSLTPRLDTTRAYDSHGGRVRARLLP